MCVGLLLNFLLHLQVSHPLSKDPVSYYLSFYLPVSWPVKSEWGSVLEGVEVAEDAGTLAVLEFSLKRAVDFECEGDGRGVWMGLRGGYISD